MAHVNIDLYDAFRAAGVSDLQAKAAAAAFPMAQEIATKRDFSELSGGLAERFAGVEKQIAGLRSEMYRALWLQAGAIVTVVVALVKLLP